MNERLGPIMCTATALNYEKVSKILILCQADCNLYNLIDIIWRYYETFTRLDAHAVAVLVNHMNTVKWSQNGVFSTLSDAIVLEHVNFSSSSSTIKVLLLSSIVRICKLVLTLKARDKTLSRLVGLTIAI